MNKFEKYLLVAAVEIKKEIKLVLSTWNSVVVEQTPQLTVLNNAFLKSFTGGKYIRGTLVTLGFEITGAKKNKDLIKKVAAAFEILHTALLIHDDVIDKSTIRRGKPTLHTLFKNSHYSISQAISLGDIGFFLATKHIAESNLPPMLKNNVLSEFSQIVLHTILGEMLDVQTSFEKVKKEKDVITIQRLKTAYYSIVGPLTIGAMIGNASQKQLHAIKNFGKYVGLAYQIQDDLLGVFGDEKKTGKSIVSDIQENKNTLLITFALKKASPSQQKFLKTYYGKKNITDKQLKTIKQIFLITGSYEYSQKNIKKYSLQAKKLIPSLTTNKKYQTYLHQFVDFLSNREN